MHGIFSTGFSRLMTLGLGMLSLMFVIRHISAEAYGAFVLIRVMCIFLVEITNLGLTLVIPKYLASIEDVQHRFRLINTVIYFRILTVFLLVPLVFMAKPGLVALFGSSPSFLNIYIYIPILLGLESLAQTLNSILQGLFRFKMLAIINALAAIGNFIATMVFVFPLELGTLGLIYAVFFSNTLLIILAYLAVQIKDKSGINFPILKQMLIFGFPLQMQYILGFVFSRIDTLVIGYFLGTAGVAFYEVARKLPESFMYLHDAFLSVYYPFIAKFHADGERENIIKFINNSNRMLLFVAGFLALVTVLFGKEIISLLFSQAYLPSYYAFVLLMFGLALSILDHTLGYSLVAIGEPTKPLIINLVRTLLSLPLNFVIIPILSFTGAGVVTVVGNLVAAPLDIYFLYKRDVRLGIAGFLNPLMISVGYSLLFLFLEAYLPPAAKTLFVFLFILTCIRISAITRDDWSVISAEAKNGIDRLLRKGEAAGSIR
jgi:O-antigen/teichoic acid export membrane protein